MLVKGPYYAHVAISRSMRVHLGVADMQVQGCRFAEHLTAHNGTCACSAVLAKAAPRVRHH